MWKSDDFIYRGWIFRCGQAVENSEEILGKAVERLLDNVWNTVWNT